MRNETHDPSITSWVESANTADTDFPIQNLPFGVFRPAPGATLAHESGKSITAMPAVGNFSRSRE